MLKVGLIVTFRQSKMPSLAKSKPFVVAVRDTSTVDRRSLVVPLLIWANEKTGFRNRQGDSTCPHAIKHVSDCRIDVWHDFSCQQTYATTETHLRSSVIYPQTEV